MYSINRLRQRDRETERQRDRETERQRDRETETETETETERTMLLNSFLPRGNPLNSSH